ncbi:MAG TPA: CapA family protein [Bacteroidales bacterium]|jgi:poly-gamma-glutamate synthesis protein (capsule biosynthesis protein)|nr:CapA family protein [Bacteroidales bacterium]
MKSTNILIGGDLGPTDSNFSQFIENRVDELIDDKLFSLLGKADLRIFNLEVPLTDNPLPISKDGPCLIAPSATFNGIKSINPSLLTLANNHILDQSEAGLFNTMSILKNNGIKFVGAGKNISEASQSVVMKVNGWKVGVYGCAETEFSIADENKSGANPFDPLESPDHIESLKSQCDYLIVLFHGGKERYRYPTPNLQKVCRKMISRGADLVVCQHSHSIGSFELFEEGVIVYGQGNFLFDRHDDEFYRTGILIKVDLTSSKKVTYIPIKKRGNGVSLADEEQGKIILDEYYKRSEEIKDPSFIEDRFNKYCKDNGQFYLATIAGLGKTIRRIDKILNRPLTRLIYTRKKLDSLQNHIECETHREIILRYIRILNQRD